MQYDVIQKGESVSNNITVRLSQKLEKELEKVAKEENTSKSEIIRNALEKYMAVKRFRHLRQKALPFAEAQGLLTDEDIFKIVS